MLNQLPTEMKGYLPTEVAYQVKKDTLYIYLRVVNFYLAERSYEPLNEVDTIQIPLEILKEQFEKKMDEFKETLYPYGINRQNHYESKAKQYSVGNIVFTFKYQDTPHRKAILFEMAYSLGYRDKVVLAEGSHDIKRSSMNITSKNGMLKHYLTK